MIKAVALDRDGTLIEHIPYLYKTSDVQILPTVIEALSLLQAHKIDLFIVTNQSGIGRGLFSESDYQVVETHINNLFTEHGITIKNVYHCPYHPEHGIGDYKRDSDDRKPNPGMLVKLMNDFNIQPQHLVMVGDSYVDIVAAHNAGIRSVLVTTGKGNEFVNNPELNPGYIAHSLMDAVQQFILEQ